MSTRSRRWLPILLLVGLTLLLTWPLPLVLATHAPDRQDPLLNAWIIAWEAHHLLIDPLTLFDANIFFPQHNALAFSETLFSTTALVLPVQWLGDSALLSHNVATLVSFFVTALGGYLLALYLTGRRGPALVAALAFAWAPHRVGQISQVQLLAFGWLPLALIYLDRLLREPPNRRSGVRDGGLFTLFFLLQALASFYSALFSVVISLLYVVGWVLWKRRLSRGALLALTGAALVVAAVMLPLALPYFEVQRSLGAEWGLALNEQFSASLQSYALAPAGTPLWGPITAPLYFNQGACCPPSTLFPGLSLLLLSVTALLIGRGGRRGLWLLIGAVGVGLSFGPTFTIIANEPTAIALPYRLLITYVPGFDAIRAPVRWVILFTLALAMLSALALARLRRPWLTFLAFALVLLEFSPAPLRLVSAPPPFPALEWLEEQPPTVILELPLVAERPAPPAETPREAWERSRLLEAQFFSTQHWHTTPDGYSGYVPTRHGDFAREMHAFPSPRTSTLLRGLGVRYLIIHEADYSPSERERFDHPLPAGIEEVARIDTDRVLALDPLVTTRPARRLPLTSLPAEQEITVPLVLVTSQPYVPLLGEPVALEVRWLPLEGQPAGPAQQTQAPLPMIVEMVGVLPMPLTTPSAGEWELSVSGTLAGGDRFEVSQQVTVGVDAPPPPTLLPVTLDGVTWQDAERVRLRWRSDAPLSRYYSVSVQRLDEEGNIVVERDGPPGGGAGTLLWQPGQRYTFTWELPLPEGLSPDETTLRLRWYDPETEDEIWLWEEDAFTPVLNWDVSTSSGD